jgi:hypothetical protein
MTPIETVGAIVGISAGVIGIIAAINAEVKERRNQRELAAKELEKMKREISGLMAKSKIQREDIEKLENRFNDFMSDLLKYFQIK